MVHSSQKKPTDKSQSDRFIKAARAAGASEDEAVFDADLRKIVKAGVSASNESRPDLKKPKGIKSTGR